MKDTKKKYWKSLEDLRQDEHVVAESQHEFPEYLPVSEGEGTNRRDFLKLMGFGVAAVSLAACEAPVKKAIPYLNKPETIDPGVPNYYASTYAEGGEFCSILVKTREGRPIKIEGNTLSSITNGGTSARVQASVLSLYDNSEYRAKKPMKGGKESNWKTVDQEIIAALEEVPNGGGSITIVSNTILSPSKKKAIAEFVAKYPSAKHVTYDPVSYSGLLDAQMMISGKRAIPGYDFSKANTIVSVNADFLGTWISPIEYANQYSKGRKISNKNAKMSKHYQFEARMSMTGANADQRIKMSPSDEGAVVAAIYNAVAASAGGETVSAPKAKANVADATKALAAAGNKGLLVSGSNDKNVQLLVAKTNELLRTKAISGVAHYRQGNDNAMNAFAQNGSDAIILLDCNPVYDSVMGAKVADAIKKAKLSVSTSGIVDETAVLTGYVAPTAHYLESWSDAEPKPGMFSLGQPTIKNIFDTRQELESILTWAGNTTSSYEYIKGYWNNMILGGNSWEKALHDGVYATSGVSVALGVASGDSTMTEIAGEDDMMMESSISVADAAAAIKAAGTGVELDIYEKVTIGDGRGSNNPWLQECPDPITKSVWDNYASISVKKAAELGVSQNLGSQKSASNYVTISDGKNSIKLPVLIQAGQEENTIAIARGYGRTRAGRVGDNIGVNVAVLDPNGKITVVADADMEPRIIAKTQTSATVMDRFSIIQEADLTEFKDNPSAGRFFIELADASGEKKKPKEFDLFWQTYDYKNHHWGMMIDLNSCTGCSACVIACHAENNVPVVGRKEVINRRDMHWMRIDRYYSSDMSKAKAEESGEYTGVGGAIRKYEEMEVASDNPEVTFQPMMCQHCNHASCETVCPVAATTHSDEGLNQMAYNRCIGTRYCANNCAYKVRRFNWFNYAEGDYTGDDMVVSSPREFNDLNPVRDELTKMVLNPDVVVRTRGVMEKCTMCVQRIQYGKLEAKKEGRRTTDEDIVSACAQACPTNAITFGDKNDPDSAISKALMGEQKERAYVVLEELNTQPNINYLTKIRNNA